MTPNPESWDDLEYGTLLYYDGPETLEPEYSTPREHEQPYRFETTESNGTVYLLTRYGGVRKLSGDHPLNDSSFCCFSDSWSWAVITSDEYTNLREQ